MTETTLPAAGPVQREDPDAAWIRIRVHQKAELYRHLVVFVAVGAVLAAIDLPGSPGRPWFPWPMGFWAIGLVMHFADVWLMGDGAGLERRMLERQMHRHRPAPPARP